MLLGPGTSIHDFLKSVCVLCEVASSQALPDPLPNKNKKGKSLEDSLVPRPSSLVGKNKGEEGLVKLIT